MSSYDATSFENATREVEQGHDLSVAQTSQLIDLMLQGAADAQQVTRLLLAIRAKGEAVDELVGAAQAMRRHMTPIHHRYTTLIDTCGTGGSGSGTFNISTSAAIVAAACGCQWPNMAIARQPASAGPPMCCKSWGSRLNASLSESSRH